MPRLLVPTCGKYRVTLRLVVSISATSLSGILYLITDGFHFGSLASTIRPTCGGAGRLELVGDGWGGACAAGINVVWVPGSAKATYTLCPSALAAKARGCW